LRFSWHPSDDILKWDDDSPAAAWPSMKALVESVEPIDVDVLRHMLEEVVSAGAPAALRVRLTWPHLDDKAFDTVLTLEPTRGDGTDPVTGWLVAARGTTDDALSRRTVIDQAVGVLMARYGSEPDAAFAELRQLSQRGNLPVVDVARRLVADARSTIDAEHPAVAYHRLIDLVLTPTTLLRAVREEARVIDFVIEHANPMTVDLDGRGPQQIIGRRLTRQYPGSVESGLLDVYRQVLATGEPYAAPLTPYVERTALGQVRGVLRLHALRLDTHHVLATWETDQSPTSE
jgi:ANTAR domain